MPEKYPIILDLNDIKKILPHREPFLFLERGEILGALTARSWMTFKIKNDIFNGHFPGNPIVPGAILFEMLGQTASLVIKVIPECQGLIGIFTGIKKLRFIDSAYPNDLVKSEIEITAHRKMGDRVIGSFDGVGFIGDNEIITMTANFAAVPPAEIKKPQH